MSKKREKEIIRLFEEGEHCLPRIKLSKDDIEKMIMELSEEES